MAENYSLRIGQKRKLITYLVLLAVLFVTIWMYLPVLDYPSIVGPDQEFVIDNTLLQDNGGTSVWDIFLSDVNGRYQPLSMVSYLLDKSMFPTNPLSGHHIINLLLHLLNILLLFRVAMLLGKNEIIALTAALLLAIHPMNVESVAWIFSRSVLLSSFFFLMGILTYLYHLKQQKSGKKFLIFTVICFLLSLFSSPIGIAFPFALVLIDYTKQRSIKKSLSEKVTYFILALGFIIISGLIMLEKPIDLMNSQPDVFQWLIMKTYALFLLLIHFIVPYGQAGFHPYTSPGLWQVLTVTSVFIAIVSAFVLLKKNRAAKACLAFFLLSGFIGLILASHPPALFREQDAYLPFMGLYILAGLALHQLLKIAWTKNVILKTFAIVFPGSWIILLTVLSLGRIPVYSNSEAIWSEVIEAYPESDHAFFMRGNYWAIEGKPDKAKFDYKQSVRNNKNAYEALTYLGLLYMNDGTPHDAIKEFSKAIEINDAFYKAYINRGIAYMSVGKNELALEDINMAVALNPSDSRVYYNRGLVYQRLNGLSDAIKDFSRAIAMDPNVYIYYKDRGKAYVWSSEFHFAELDYSRALEIYDGDGEMWFRRSLARTSQSKFKEGLEDAFMARKLGFTVEEEYIKGLTVQVLQADSVPIE